MLVLTSRYGEETVCELCGTLRALRSTYFSSGFLAQSSQSTAKLAASGGSTEDRPYRSALLAIETSVKSHWFTSSSKLPWRPAPPAKRFAPTEVSSFKAERPCWNSF